jgi:hypothetical protein
MEAPICQALGLAARRYFVVQVLGKSLLYGVEIQFLP